MSALFCHIIIISNTRIFFVPLPLPRFNWMVSLLSTLLLLLLFILEIYRIHIAENPNQNWVPVYRTASASHSFWNILGTHIASENVIKNGEIE